MRIGTWLRRGILALALAAAPIAAATAQPVDPPYEADLLRLSEILGALHYLEDLCDDAAQPAWRDQMALLIEAEQPSEERRARLVDRFNLGYSSFASVYRTCTPAATTAVDRYQHEGLKLSREIIARYGR